MATIHLTPTQPVMAQAASDENGEGRARAASSLTDTERRLTTLLQASIAGDKHAYQGFLSELARHLRIRLHKHLWQQDADIEDLVQEVLIAVHKGLDTFRPDVPLTAWISAIVRYKLADHFRASARRGELFQPLDDDASTAAMDIAVPSNQDAFDAQRDLDRLLATLPPRQRESIVQTKLWGRSVAETAASTGLTESAVKVSVHRGLKALAAKIKRRSHED
ncbi:RNA polymerase sigma factor (plasmid) [Paraburkholderia largidicola]|uniref:RNA polymerase sigma factor n=2 Tax=Paraburkholderia largidicola TaxID=3014751 RepID=A0A7I8C5C9_9BURK|nr:RNA polymerase sigma factor [Paraburkholderia sp. PGU16]